MTPRSRQTWRAWLEKYHTTKAEIWLVYYKKHSGKPTLSYGDSVEEALCFGWIDGVKRSIDTERYTHRFSPRRPDSRWSAANRKRAESMEAAGLMTDAGRRVIEAAKAGGQWDAPAPTVTVDLSMPPELVARLGRNRKAAAFFDSLTERNRQQFIGWINLAKRPETRQRRIDETIQLLARGEKLGMR